MNNSPEVTTSFLRNLISEFNELEEVYLAHLQENDQILPYVLMDELTRILIDRVRDNSPQGRQLFSKFAEYLENAVTNLNEEISTMIRTSFCESIDSVWKETELHYWICSRLGPNLRESLLISPTQKP